MRTQSGSRTSAAITLAVALGLLAALLVPASQASAQPGGPLTFANETPRTTAFKAGSMMEIGGTVPDGADIIRATFVAIEADGDEVRRNVGSTILNRPAPGPFEEVGATQQWLENDGGSIDGRLTAPCLFKPYLDSNGNVTCNIEHQDAVEGYFELVLQGGGGVAHTSNLMDVDFVEPAIQQYVFLESDVVRVVFTEPVSITNPNFPYNEQGDLGEDWVVNDGAHRVTSIDTVDNDCQQFGFPADVSGCTRLLTLNTELEGDAPPLVDYDIETIGLNGLRGLYADAAGTNVFNATGQTHALDRIRPFIPSIDDLTDATGDAHVPGAVPAEVTCDHDAFVLGNSLTPTLTLSNLPTTTDYVVEVGGTQVLGPTSVSGAPVTVALPSGAVTRDALNVIEVHAVDPAGNRSDDTTLSPPAASTGEDDPQETNPLCYFADVTRPAALAAARTGDPRALLVTFAQPDLLLGGDDEPMQVDAGQWAIGSLIGTATTTGQPHQRLITFDADLPQSQVTLTWTRDDDAANPDYTDAAGNVMVSPTNLPILPPPPIDAPVFTVPSATTPRFVTTDPFTVTGGYTAGTDPADVSDVLVSVLGDTSDVSATLTDGTWSADIALGADGPYRFDAFARSIFGASSPLRNSTEIVLDTIDPFVDLIVPAPPGSGGLFGGEGGTDAGEGTALVQFLVDDTNLERAEITATFPDGTGIDPVTITYDGPSTGQTDETDNRAIVELEIPGGFTGPVEVEIVAHDLAGRTSVIDSGVFNVTDDLFGTGRLIANDAGDTVIDVGFAAPLEGNTTTSEWSATGGVEGNDNNRTPSGTEVVNRDAPAEGETVSSVLLDFPSPFPGGLLSSAEDDNALPTLTYNDGAFGNLSGPAGRDIVVNPTVLDRVPPTRLQASANGTVSDGRAKLDDDGFVATFNGSTDASSRPNTITVSRDNNGQPGAVIIPAILANADGTFTFDLPVDPNATTSVILEVSDPAGNAGPMTAAAITEDSLGPVVSSLVATLSTAGVVDIAYRLTDEGAADQRVNRGDLTYRVGGGDFIAIEGGSSLIPDDEQGNGTFEWDVPEGIDLAAGGVQIAMVGTDDLGNVGQPATTGLANVPVLVRADAESPTSVLVSTSEPVDTDDLDNAGFSILGGPGVTSAMTTSGDQIRLSLNAELPGGRDLRVAYNGQGGWATPDGRPLQAGSVPLAIDLLVPVQDLAAGATGVDTAVLSFVDEINDPAIVAGYEIARDGQVVNTVDRDTRVFHDDAAGVGAHVYNVVTVATDGRRSDAATVAITLGESPVPDDVDGSDGGTGFPSTSDIVDECVFTAEPNITPSAGGVVLSCDGRVAAIVPPFATDVALYGKFIQRSDSPADGFANLTDLYQLVAVTDTDFATVDDFARYTEISFRALGEVISDGVPELMTTLRLNDELTDEQAPRVGRESLSVHLITVGTFRTVEALGRSIRVYGPDPAIPADRFATAVALSQTQFRRAGAAVIARADEYPDALSAAPLAAQVGGPVLLSHTDLVPPTTVLELYRLNAQTVTIVGGTAAVSSAAEQQLIDLGFTVRRIAGDNRFTTSALVAREVGSVDGGAFLATGQNFADALSASAPAASLGRPILLTATDSLLGVTVDAARAAGVDHVHLVGGTAALTDGVATAVTAAGFDVRRSAGANRSATAVALATDLIADGLVTASRPLVASADGDGRTSPDALAAGPISGRLGSILLLTPKSVLPGEVASFMGGADGLAGMLIAGGPAAIDPAVRSDIDATG